MTILMTGGDRPLGEYRVWIDCWNCGGEGFSDHDCGEDCCCCAFPEDNVVCDICEGEGGWLGIPEADDL
jgi:hypothetical protein